MMTDPDFKQIFVDSWQMLRSGALSKAGLAARVDALGVQLSDAGAADSPQKRNFIRWGSLGSQTTGFQAFLPANLRNSSETWAGHVQYVKDWAALRSTWMDSQFTAMPAAGTPAGAVTAGSTVALTSPHAVYATLDGTDPRLSGGVPNPAATVLPTGGSPVLTINATSRLLARARTATGEWSAPLDLWYIVGQVATPASLIVSELQYHAADPTPAEQLPDGSLSDGDFEFIELKNISASTLDLSGAAFTDGIDYSFPAGSLLAPGATLVLVSNAAAFPRRYGAGIAVSGDYGGQLDNTGDRLELAYPFGAPVLAFTWRDAWHTPTDGTGYSLVALNQNAPADGNLPDSWAISPQLNGSPGIPASGYSLTFESWRHYHFTAAEQLQSGLAGPQDDPDGDSLVNLMEYALGTEPRTSTAGAAQPLPGLAAVGPDRFLTLTWSRPVRALDLTYTARFSPDLVTWSENSVMVGSPVPSTDGMETVRFRGTAKASPQVPGFSRLQVSKQ